MASGGLSSSMSPQEKAKKTPKAKRLKSARGDILVFSDVATILDAQALKEILSNFADPNVGCVSSEDRLIGETASPAVKVSMCAMRCGCGGLKVTLIRWLG